MTSSSYQARPKTDAKFVIKRIFTALSGLKFGSVEILVHEGRIVQIERREKQRMSVDLTDLDPIETSSGPNSSP